MIAAVYKEPRCNACGKRNLGANPRFEICSNCEKRQYQVYVFKVQGFIKIGYSCHVEKRLANLQYSSPFPIEEVFRVQCGTFLKARELEILMHIKSFEWKVHGEWFKYDIELINNLKQVALNEGLTDSNILQGSESSRALL